MTCVLPKQRRRSGGDVVLLGESAEDSFAGPTWKQLLIAQARGIIAAAFVHVDTVPLRRLYALIVIENGTHRAYLVGITAFPDGARTTEAARNNLRLVPSGYANHYNLTGCTGRYNKPACRVSALR